MTFILLTFWKMLLNVNGDYFYMGRDHVWHTRTCRTFTPDTWGFCTFAHAGRQICRQTHTHIDTQLHTILSFVLNKKKINYIILLLLENVSNDQMIPTPPGSTNLFKPLSVKIVFLLSSIIFNLTSVAAWMSYLISFLMLWGTGKKA